MARMVSLASNPGPRLHRAATLCLKAVERTVKENPALLVPVLQQLLGADGFFNLDERVRNSEDGIKPIETLLRSANASNVADVVDTLRTAALAADTGYVETLSRRAMLTDAQGPGFASHAWRVPAPTRNSSEHRGRFRRRHTCRCPRSARTGSARLPRKGRLVSVSQADNPRSIPKTCVIGRRRAAPWPGGVFVSL